MKNNQIKLVLERLLRSIFNKNCFHIVNTYVDFISQMRKNNGLKQTIKYMKTSKLHITRYICGQPLKSNSDGVSLDKDYFPTRLNFLKKLSKESPRIVMTLLSYTRALNPDETESKARVVKLDSIIDPYKGKDYTIPLWFINKFINDHNLSLSKPNYTDEDHYLSIKGSPNGKASKSSMWSILCHTPNTLEYIRVLSGSYFKIISEWYTYLCVHHQDLIDKEKNNLGKLSIVHDPELKERVIAMVDYTSQFILRPIHEQLLNLLKKLPSDRTFNQDPYHNWTNNGNDFHSLDLSAATDRFPIKLQQKFISCLYKDEKFAEAWKNLLVDRSYVFQNNYYRYSVGQPMGAYTSWAAFTITHHLLVHWAAHLCGVNDFKDYIILGDDIVIKHNKIANKYKTLMTRLGVDISINKTHVSSDTYEFAKRWIKGNSEISGLSLKGILNNFQSIHMVYMNLFNYKLRIPSQDWDLLDTLGSIYAGIKVNNRIKSKNTTISCLIDFHHSIRFSFGLLTYQEIRRYLGRKFFKLDEFNLWPESLIPYKIREILSHGMVSRAVNLGRKVSNQINILRDKNIDFLLLTRWPLTLGFYNHIEKMSNLVDNFRNGKSQLIEIVSGLNLNNLDGVLNSKLNSKELIFMDKLWKDSFSVYFKALHEEIHKEPEIDDGRSLERFVMANFWKPQATYKATTVGLKTFEIDLSDRFFDLKRELEWMNLPPCIDERKPTLQDQIWQESILAKKEGRVIDFSKFQIGINPTWYEES